MKMTIKKNLSLTMINQIGIKTKLPNSLFNKIQEEEEVIEVIDKIEIKMDKMIIKMKDGEEEEIEILTLIIMVIKIDLNIPEEKIIMDEIVIIIMEGKEMEETGEVVIEVDIVGVLGEIKTEIITMNINKEMEETLIEEIKTMTDMTTDNRNPNLKIINPHKYLTRVKYQYMMLSQLLNQKVLNLGLKSVFMSENVKSQ